MSESKRVPREPTIEMARAGYAASVDGNLSIQAMWRAMWDKAIEPDLDDFALSYGSLRAKRDALRAALRECFCPRPANNRPDGFTVGECTDAKECGCVCGAPLAAPDAARVLLAEDAPK